VEWPASNARHRGPKRYDLLHNLRGVEGSSLPITLRYVRAMNFDSMQWWWSEWSVETTSSKQISKPLLSFICIFKVLHDSSQESQIRLGPPLAWRSDRLPTRRLGGKIKSTILLRYPRRSILTLTLAATPQREFRNGRSPRMSTSARTCRFGYHSPQERWLVRLR
jgi:hypothetical protein